jgi:hypothetical protein
MDFSGGCTRRENGTLAAARQPVASKGRAVHAAGSVKSAEQKRQYSFLCFVVDN